MPLTKEEYTKKLSELRKERDRHQNEAYRIGKEMDELESDMNMVDVHIGQYVTIDRRYKGGYLEYFHVDTYSKRPRGVTLYGKGFSVSDKGQTYLHISDAVPLYWDEIYLPKEITAEEFHEAFNTLINNLKMQLIDYKTHKNLGDEIAFADKLRKGEIKAVWKDELITKES